MTQWWSWALTVVGVFGLYLAGKRSPWGWVVGIGAQILWLAYALATRQWGFLVSCFAYGFVYVKNFRSWRRADQATVDTGSLPRPANPIGEPAGPCVPGCLLTRPHMRSCETGSSLPVGAPGRADEPAGGGADTMTT